MNKIAIFISGSGSNAENIIKHFAHHAETEIAIVLSDNDKAYGLKRAQRLNIPAEAFSRADFRKGDKILRLLQDKGVNFIALAGFLSFVPEAVTSHYKGRIVNIHPSLLPRFGGKGMYGARVHQAVVAAGAKESGISIHYVNEHFDEGEIIFQASCPVLATDSAEDVEAKVRALEIAHYPKVIEAILKAQEAWFHRKADALSGQGKPFGGG